MWKESVLSPQIVDGYTIKLERGTLGHTYDNEILYKATTIYKYPLEPKTTCQVTKYGRTISDAVTNLLNYLTEVKEIPEPIEPF